MIEVPLDRGYRGVIQYDHKFVRVFYHNIVNNRDKLFKSNEEANFTISSPRVKFSVLKNVDEHFLISGKYEFLLYYEELNISLHWEQTRSIHLSSNDENIGYNPLHIGSDINDFN